MSKERDEDAATRFAAELIVGSLFGVQQDATEVINKLKELEEEGQLVSEEELAEEPEEVRRDLFDILFGDIQEVSSGEANHTNDVVDPSGLELFGYYPTTEQKILQFAQDNWGDKDLDGIALKLAEETGEIAGACVKIPEGRATTEDLDDELGDALIVLSQFAAKRDTTLEDLRARRFEKIKERANGKENQTEE